MFSSCCGKALGRSSFSMADFLETELGETIAAARELVNAGDGAGAETKLSECDDLLAQLRIDARTSLRRKELEARLRAQAAEVEALRGRGNLFKGAAPAPAAAGRDRLARAQARTEESSARVDATRALVEDMEETGRDILDELGRNKETIASINGNISTTKGDLQQAEKITTRMSKWWNRW